MSTNQHQDFDYGQLSSLASAIQKETGVAREVAGAVLNGYVNSDQFPTAAKYAPRLLTNQFGNQIYDQIKTELEECQSFTFAVAFITDAMLSNLKPIFLRLANHGVQGRLLTSTYLCFNSPKVFHELLKIPNLEVRLADVDGFHQKGYIYEKEGYQTIIIGSANLTEKALMKNQNYEWSLQISSLDNGEIVHQVSENVETEWRAAQALTEGWIELYASKYAEAKPALQQIHSGHVIVDRPGKQTIKPNQMQRDALGQIQNLRNHGADRGLVVSATGTGKTYLAAFDVQNYRPKRMLFIAHREQILNKSRQSFQLILGGPDQDFGLFTGNHHETDAKYVFATNQTLAKEANLKQFKPDQFDYILIDEVHHVGASTYQRILDYFKPQFFLGMTATPERNDDFNVFELFHYQIAYEIRLQDALLEGMLCPFHYVGVHDFEFKNDADNEVINQYNAALAKNKSANDLEQRALSLLSSQERVKYILQATDYYGYSGDVLHGLVFCSNRQEAKEIAAKFTQQGHPAKALTGEDSQTIREAVVAELEAGKIDYIVTVDIFNEGIDIPCVNQVVFLRNTNSSIIYTQQLGRGLRKASNKDYVEIIDFIGNYQNNYLIPIALTGDNSASKDNARGTINTEPTIGLSTIAFDEVAKEKIYESLRQVKLDEMRRLKGIYQNIKQRVGRIPRLEDFYRFDSVDPEILANKQKNYARFLQKMKEDVVVTDQEDKWLTFLTAELLNGKRLYELTLLELLLNQQTVTGKELLSLLKARGAYLKDWSLWSMRQVLSLQFFSEKAAPNRAGYGGESLINWDETSDTYTLNIHLQKALKTNEWFAKLWRDGVTTGVLRSKRYLGATPFKLGEKYTRKDTLRLTGYKQNLTPLNIGGYYFTDREGLIFMTYDKAENIQKSIDYEDRLLDDQHLHYYSKNNRRLDSSEIKKFQSGDYELQLFVQKSGADDNKTFYYLGTMKYTPGSARQEEIAGKPIVSMNFTLAHPVEHNLYELFTKGN